MIIEWVEHPSPIGPINLAVHAGRLCALGFPEHWARKRAALERRCGRVEWLRRDDAADMARRLAAYFAGDLQALRAVEIDLGGTPFQQRVWTALRRLPPGQTASYGELARAIGHATAVRAVGAANGANPVGIVVPCHRVIGADGSLTGYGGGIERKRWLLRHEGIDV